MSWIFWDTTSAAVLPSIKRRRRRSPPFVKNRSIHPTDAIQLACASVAGVDMFITNDHRLSRHVVPGIHFIQSLAVAAL